MKIEEANVNELCGKAIAEQKNKVANGVTLTFHTSLADTDTIETDRYRTLQAINEMLANAIKNTTKGSILLDCRKIKNDQGTDSIAFCVTDTGCGIAPKHHKKLFERFVKLDSNKQGAGLGLYICRTIATKLGGSITLDPNYTTGARFILTLPVVVQTATTLEEQQ